MRRVPQSATTPIGPDAGNLKGLPNARVSHSGINDDAASHVLVCRGPDGIAVEYFASR